MKVQSFKKWLKDMLGFEEEKINSIVANCKRIEAFYGNLDTHYIDDRLSTILKEFNEKEHRIPIDDDSSDTSTLKSTLKHYLEFKDNEIVKNVMDASDIDPDKHDGSYELVREAVDSLSKSNTNDLGVDDLDMLYSMSVGTWRMSIDNKIKRIDKSSMLDEEKLRLKSVLDRIKINAENNKYKNRENGEPTIGMFGTGFFTFRGNTNDEEARKFISLVVEIKDLTNEENIFNILEEGFKDGINGIQSGSACMVLHCLKPKIFPIITARVIKSIVVLESAGVKLIKPNLLTNYIGNTKILREFRDNKCEFKNYRVLDIAIWDTEVSNKKLNDLLEIPKEELKNYKIKLNIANPEGIQPIDIMIDNEEERLGWMSYKHTKEDLSRKYVIGLAREYTLGDDYWRFLGVFEVLERYTDKTYTEAYKLKELEKYDKYKNKTSLKYKNKIQNLTRNAENMIDELVIAKNGIILPMNDEVNKAWFVGAMIDGKDKLDEFIKESTWQSGHEDKFKDIIKSIKVGDHIAIKSSYTKKHNLPFNTNNNYASTMAVKATGVVTKNLGDGKKLEVNWFKLEPKKEWYFFTMRETIWEVIRNNNDWMHGNLLDFTFNNEPQNIERFLQHPFWADRYSIDFVEPNEEIKFDESLDFDNLYFTDEKVLKSQISIALKSGKSIILIGPPGTGKSKIAKAVAKSYGADSKMVTAMSDWSSYDTIGGYKPNPEGSLYFEEGIFLSSFKSKEGENINKWLIIDEINRADIDKAFGPFFSALSGDDVELGSRDDENRNIEILLEQNIEESIEGFDTQTNQYIIPKDWRIIGTMNTFDKTSLYEMSYAFMRRFAFIPVAIPKDIDDLLVERFFKLWDINISLTQCGEIAEIWKVINKYRKVGPAIIEDIGNYVSQGGDYTSAIVIYILPQLEGLFDTDIAVFVDDLMGLGFIKNKDRLIESIEDFFNTSLPGK